VERALRAFVASAGEYDLDGQLGELARALEPARYRAKTELVLRELVTTHVGGPANRPADDHGARTVVASQRPQRIATHAAPAARSSPPAAIDGADEARTIPLSAQARAAVASVAPVPPRALGPMDATQPTMRRADFEPAIAAADASRGTGDPTAPEFANPAPGVERTMVAGHYPSPAAAGDPGIGQTLVGAVPQHIYDQIANAPPPPSQQPPAHSLPPPAQPGLPSMPPPARTFQTPPPAPDGSSKRLWAAVAVGMVLFVVAALVALTQLR